MKLTDFKVLTFDCYGTLIDWEAGIFDALRPLCAKLPQPRARDAVLEEFARHESAQEAETPAMIYSALLSAVHRRLAREWKIAVSDAELPPDEVEGRFMFYSSGTTGRPKGIKPTFGPEPYGSGGGPILGLIQQLYGVTTDTVYL